MTFVRLLVGLVLTGSTLALRQDLDSADVRITLDAALPIALKAASREFPDLHNYILYSVTPRVLKGDRRGLHWEFEWREKAVPDHKSVRGRWYLRDGSIYAKRMRKGEPQKAHKDST